MAQTSGMRYEILDMGMGVNERVKKQVDASPLGAITSKAVIKNNQQALAVPDLVIRMLWCVTAWVSDLAWTQPWRP